MNKKSNIKINISSDEYNAFMSIKPDQYVPLSLTELGPILKEHGVVQCIKKDALMTVVEKYKNGEPIDNFLIAEGIRPYAGIQPEVIYNFEISSKPKENESGKVDYREISKILNVEKGQLLAVKKKLKEPVDGMTVTGKQTPFPEFIDIEVNAGTNIEVENLEDVINYKAAVDGALRFENNTMAVYPTLEIQEDVDFNVGNIHYNGSVKIGRDVLPDFVVEATGSIKIWGSAIACTLKSNDDIEVRAGIVGKNKGLVESNGNLTATFVENSTLAIKGNIEIKNGIIGSDVQCDGSLTVSMPRSRIIGSSIKSAKWISVHNAGSRFDTSASFITGINPEKESVFLKTKEAMEQFIKEAHDIEAKHGRAALENKTLTHSFSMSARKDMAKWEKIKSNIQNLNATLKILEEKMYDYNAYIKVKETLFPRVKLKIGKHTITSHKEFYNVTVKYSKEAGQLVIE
jgi:uncharacterized protein